MRSVHLPTDEPKATSSGGPARIAAVGRHLIQRAGFSIVFGLLLFALAFATVTVKPAAGARAAAPSTSSSVSAATLVPVMPHWVYQMINDFNLGISQPSGVLSASYSIYQACVAVPPNFYFVDGNSKNMAAAIKMQFVSYNKLIPRWIKLISKLKPTPASRLAKAKLTAAQPLHLQEVSAWENAAVAIKAHDCASFLADLKQAKRFGAPDWADQYVAVKAIAELYGSNAASHQTPYAQKLG